LTAGEKISANIFCMQLQNDVVKIVVVFDA